MSRILFFLATTLLLLLTTSMAQGETLNQFLASCTQKNRPMKEKAKLKETFRLQLGDLARARIGGASILWLGMQGAMGKLSPRQLHQNKMEVPPAQGECIGLMVSGLIRDPNLSNASERSNIVFVEWPW